MFDNENTQITPDNFADVIQNYSKCGCFTVYLRIENESAFGSFIVTAQVISLKVILNKYYYVHLKLNAIPIYM